MSKTKWIALALALALLCALLPVTALGADPPPAFDGAAFDMMADIARQLRDPDQDPFAFETVPATRRGTRGVKALPAAYDLRHVDSDDDGVEDACYVTPVKNQGNLGNCWAFAAIASAETSILSSGLAAAQGLVYAVTPDTPEGLLALDLSEKHLAYFFMQPVDDPADPQNGEGYFYAGEELRWDWYYSGGMPFYATGLLASGTGPVSEYGYVYDTDNDTWVQPFIYRGKAGNIEYWDNKPYAYSVDDDWSIDGRWRWYQDYVLKESYLLPTPAGKEGEEKAAAIRAIKEQLLAGHAVQIGYCADGSDPGEDRETYFISPNWAHYTYDKTAGADHAVVIIGWDDNYPKENFAHKTHDGEAPLPQEDGAWLVKNSWGSHEEEFPNKGYDNYPWGLLQGQDRGVYNEEKGAWEYYANGPDAVATGYFWLSYEDESVCMLEALDFDAANSEEGYYLYQYDFLPVSDVRAAKEPVSVRMANVFRAEADGIIDRVSCQTTTPGTHVRYEVYLLDADAADPLDGVPVAAAEAVYPYGGFHKALLDTPTLLTKGQNFAVVVTQMTPGGEYCLNTQTSTKCGPGNTIQNRCVVNPGESFFYVEGAGWFDLSSEENRRLLIEDLVETEYLDNFPIKAYLTIPETPAEPETPEAPEAPEAPDPPGGWDDGWYWDDGGGAPAGENVESKQDAPEPEPPEPEPAAFEDVEDDAWYAEAVAWAVAAGIAEGTDEGFFSPDLPCTRSQMVTFLWRAAGCPEPEEGEELPFTDTEPDSYYDKAVRWAVTAGITAGMDETHFAPDVPVSRLQAVAFLFRAFGSGADGGADAGFDDVAPDAWYAEAVAWAAANGITLGVDETHFAPELDCTRAQIVTFLYRAFSQMQS